MAAARVPNVAALFGKCARCRSTLNPAAVQLRRQIGVSSGLRRKNLAAAGPEKFTPEFVQQQVEEYETGRRRLANMMGEDPESFTQEDVDRSIAYLFPSGLFEKKARPVMKHPEEIFPQQRAAQWAADGRPLHFLFYTGKPSYYTLVHDIYGKIVNVEKQQDRLRAKGLFSADSKLKSLGASRWLSKEDLEALLVENISSADFERFVRLMERLAQMPHSGSEEEFVLRFRRRLEAQSMNQEVAPLQSDERGVAFSTAEGRRKSSSGSVLLRDCGAGRVTINGQNYLDYFPVLQDREQLMFPLQFLDLLGRFDLECSVSGGGRSGQAGALRLATARALLGFVTEREGEAMRRAGLLTADPRVRERKKPGQEGARRKFTWKKR